MSNLIEDDAVELPDFARSVVSLTDLTSRAQRLRDRLADPAAGATTPAAEVAPRSAAVAVCVHMLKGARTFGKTTAAAGTAVLRHGRFQGYT